MKKIVIGSLLCLLTPLFSWGQERVGIGTVGNPHAILQLRYDATSRKTAINQVYELLEKNKRRKLSIFQREIKDIDLNSILGIKTLKPDVSRHLEGILGIDLSKRNLEGEEKAAVKSLYKSGDSTVGNEDFKNKLGFGVKIKGLKYKIEKDGVTISTFNPYMRDDKLMIDLAIDLKNINVGADQICLTFSPPNPETGYLDNTNRSNFDCDKVQETQYTLQDNMLSLLNGDDSNVVQGTNANDQGKSDFLKDIGVSIRGIDVKVSDNAISLKFTVSMFINSEGYLDLNIEKASLDRLVQELTVEDLQEKISLDFRNNRVANIYGLTSIILQGYPINISDEDINNALIQRKADLLKLILKPVSEDLGKLVDQLEEGDKTNFKVKLRKDIQISKDENSPLAQKIGLEVSSFNFIDRGENLKQLYATLNMVFESDRQSPYEKTPQELAKEAELGGRAVEKIFQSIGEYGDPSSEADIVISLGENLFNDLINFGMETAAPMLEKEGLEVPFLNFHINDLGIAESYLTPEQKEAMQDRTHVGTFHGSITYTPPKKFLALLFKMCLWKSCLQLPLLTTLETEIIVEDDTPVLLFDMPIIVNDKEFLRDGVAGVDDSNLRQGNFGGLTAKVASNKINKLFNQFAEVPMLKIKLNPFRGVNPEQLIIKADTETKRINIMLKFDPEGISKGVVEKIDKKHGKIEVTTPKLDMIKSVNEENKKSKRRRRNRDNN